MSMSPYPVLDYKMSFGSSGFSLASLSLAYLSLSSRDFLTTFDSQTKDDVKETGHS